ncbi:MAG: glycosyltransferase family 4 protein [Chthoniobacterales bacterium]|jgi:UDP-glucose:(heptosyl)LPS alpha-1,3-glucosyltransferase
MIVRQSNPTAPRPIALVRRGYSPTGGAEKFLSRFAAVARKSGRHLVLICDRPWPEDVLDGMPQTVLRGKTPWAFAQSVEKWRRSWGDGIVFSLERLISADCYRAGDGVHAAWMRRRLRYDPFWQVWLRLAGRKQRHLYKLERYCFSREHTGAVVVNSRLVAEEITKLFSYPEDRIHLVRNGVPEDYARGAMGKLEARRALGLPENAFLAAFAGTGWKRKGLRFALPAMAKAALPGSKLVVAGRGRPPARPAVETVFLGPQRDIRPVLAAADVFILPTIYDPFSNACLEALAMGRPVITTGSNGCSEILSEGVTGSVVESADDITGLADALRFWEHGGRAATAADACRATAAQCSLAENVRRTLEILEKIRPD